MTLTVPERIVDFLKKHRGTAYCDDCIWGLVGLSNRHQAQIVNQTLGLCSGYTRTEGRCQSCQSDKDKRLTKAN